MQDVTRERAFYDDLFTRNPDNEHITEGYDELYALAIPEPPAGLVLDVGCGTGAHAVRLARNGCAVVAIDLTRGGVRMAKQRFEQEGLRGHFAVADAEHLPLRDRAVDTTWSSLLLHHFPKLDRVPNELARITRERIIAFEPNAHNLLTWFAFNVVNQIWGLSTTTKNQRALRPAMLRRYFKAVGFSPSALHYIHRAWQDESGMMGAIRGTYDWLSRLLPLRNRANKFLIVFLSDDS